MTETPSTNAPGKRPSYRVAAIIVNYRTPELTASCLASLEGEITPSKDVAVVVDNGSDDDSVDRIKQTLTERGWDPWAVLIGTPSNQGLSAGINAALHSIRAQFYLFLNSDTTLRSGALVELLDGAASDSRVGVVAPRLEWPDGGAQTSVFRYPTPLSELTAAAATGPLSRVFRNTEVAIPPSETPHSAEWASFAAVLIRGRALADIGTLDERYFLFFEDVDCCRRLADKGWSVLYWPNARVVHLRGQSSSVKRDASARRRLPRYYYASRARYFAKFYGRTGLLLANLLWTAGRAISLFRETLGSKEKHTCARQGFDIWTNWLDPLER